AADFTAALHRHTTQRVVAAGSRSIERARAFAAAHGVDRAHGSYDALVADPDVDVVYVATPHSEHLEHALLAIAAGKH
ncbi:Gfo/Idh/MocA family oxidoreductase, partial [Bacillus sp. SIMBA_074]